MEYKKLNGFSLYHICENGNIYREGKNGEMIMLTKFKIPNYNGLRIKMTDDTGIQYTKILKIVVYEAFKGKISDNVHLFYLDGNYRNCNYRNLVSSEELIDFYKEYKLQEMLSDII